MGRQYHSHALEFPWNFITVPTVLSLLPPFEQHKTGQLRNLYSSTDIVGQIKSRRVRWAGHVARIGEEKKLCRVLVGKPEGKPRRRWEDRIRMDLKENGWGGVWSGFTWLRIGTVGGLL
jgi:hypothetical protein